MMGWHHADRSTFSVHIKTVGITGEEWISASYLSLIETNGFMFPASLFNLFFPNRHFVLSQEGTKVNELFWLSCKSRAALVFLQWYILFYMLANQEEDVCLSAVPETSTPFAKYRSISETTKSKQCSKNINVFPG